MDRMLVSIELRPIRAVRIITPWFRALSRLPIRTVQQKRGAVASAIMKLCFGIEDNENGRVKARPAFYARASAPSGCARCEVIAKAVTPQGRLVHFGEQ
jgi:hypothetical protein